MSDGGQQGGVAGPVDLSPGVTTVAFDPIIPPLRIPVRAGDNDDPSKGEWVLTFTDDDSWRRCWKNCHRKISEQCEMGARMGCSISAANACRIPWWKQALVFIKAAKLEEGERDACEEKEMMACLADSKQSCTNFARDTCDPVFADARIAEKNVPVDPRFKGPPRRRRLTREIQKQIKHGLDAKNPDALLADKFQVGSNESSESEVESKKSTNYRGRKLITKEPVQTSWDAPGWSESAVEGGSSRATEATIDGWEGGLIRPKFDSQTVQSRDETVPDVKKDSIWQVVEHRVRGLFKDVRI